MNATDWNPETGYPPNTPAWTLPWRPRGAGTHLGLSVVLDPEVKEFYCSTSASIGFKVRATVSTAACGVTALFHRDIEPTHSHKTNPQIILRSVYLRRNGGRKGEVFPKTGDNLMKFSA